MKRFFYFCGREGFLPAFRMMGREPETKIRLNTKMKKKMNEQAYLERFENKMQQDLLRLCTTYHMLDGVWLSSEDINEHWLKLAPEYLADAVGQVSEYPTVSVAWAAYLGLAMAYGWDMNWEVFSRAEYRFFYGSRGFDDMDEHIVRDILGISLDSEEAASLEEMIRRCAQTAVDLIRREQIEPQSPMAYYAFSRACWVMYGVGAALGLKKLGYKLEKLDLSDSNTGNKTLLN